VTLGTHANKQGRVIGHNLAGSYATFPGVVGTAVSKVCHLEIARTGLRERDATRAGFGYVIVTVRSGTKAGYFPGTQRMTVKMIAELCTGRLLGVQIVGYEGSAKRIDAAAVALWNRMTVEEMTALDLAYAPPFAPVWDPILVAARQSRQERLRLGTGVLMHALGVAALSAGDLDRAEQWARSLYEQESEVCYLAWHAQEILVAVALVANRTKLARLATRHSQARQQR
jgi:hypothetical protein